MRRNPPDSTYSSGCCNQFLNPGIPEPARFDEEVYLMSATASTNKRRVTYTSERLDSPQLEAETGDISVASRLFVLRVNKSATNFTMVVGIDVASRVRLNEDRLNLEFFAVAGSFVSAAIGEFLAASAWHVLAEDVASTVNVA